MTACGICGGFDYRHDPVAHGEGPAWITCPTCNGDGAVRDTLDLDVTCPDCDGDGGREA